MNGRRARQLHKLASMLATEPSNIEYPAWAIQRTYDDRKQKRGWRRIGNLINARHAPMSRAAIYQKLKRAYTRGDMRRTEKEKERDRANIRGFVALRNRRVRRNRAARRRRSNARNIAKQQKENVK
jgi:hypothetical protein